MRVALDYLVWHLYCILQYIRLLGFSCVDAT